MQRESRGYTDATKSYGRQPKRRNEEGSAPAEMTVERMRQGQRSVEPNAGER